MDQTQPLKPQQVAAMLEATSNLLQAEFESLPPEVLSWHPAPSEWCILQVLGHLIETEKAGFANRIPMMLEQTNPHFVSLDQDAEAIERKDCERDPIELLNEFVLIRIESCKLVASLKEGDLRRGGWHPDADYLRITDFLHEWVYHDQDHIRQMMANVQAYVWDYLGATQEWYQPE